MRPILIATLGYIIGILWELYFKSIALFILIIIIIILIVFIMTKKDKKINKHLKVLLPKKQIVIFMIFAMIAVCRIKNLEYEYEKICKEFNNNEVAAIGTIISNKKEYDYRDAYIVRIENIQNKNIRKKLNNKILLKIEKNQDLKFELGDKISFNGEFKKSNSRTNYKGYSYEEYLKSKAIYGEIETTTQYIQVIGKNNVNVVNVWAKNCKEKIIDHIKQILPKESCDLCLGILIGYTDEMQENLKTAFKDASLSHMLAVSGSHIAYIIVGVAFLAEKVQVWKKIYKIFTILFLVFFMFLTGFTPSITRACIMGIVMMISEIIYRENDFICSISLSALIMLIINPFNIYDAGFKLSFGGTIGIVLFQKNVKKMILRERRKKRIKYINYNAIMIIENKKVLIKRKIKYFLVEALTVTIAAQIAIIPIIMLDFNTISLTFFISNMLASFFMGIITIGGFILVLVSLVSIEISKLIANIYNVPVVLLIKIVEWCAKIPGTKIFVITVHETTVLVYYILLLMWNYLNDIKNKNDSGLKRLVEKKLNIIKYKARKNKECINKLMVIILIIIICILFIRNKFREFRMYFIDVGQGDCTVIVTPNNQRIIIDGGGNNIEDSSYDVGESVVFPYLLDRQIGQLDYLIISHFDSDHYKGLEYILKNMKVKKIIIPKQFEKNENYQEFIKLIANKKIKVKQVTAGESIKLEKDIYMQVLWPTEKYITENIVNNNSMVFKLYYKDTSILFTGDIEETAEKEIVNMYKNINYKGENILKSDILKVAHHGSKTSSIQEFIEEVQPKIALIGVGKNNNFGHPSIEILNRLKLYETKVFRTDKDGEIEVVVNSKTEIKVNKFINSKSQ